MSPRTFVARSAAILSLAALGLAACESKTIVTPPTQSLAIVVSPASVTLTAAGQKAQFVALVTGGTADQVKTYSWNSSNTAVATVDANGVVTAVANGSASIIATTTADATVRAAGLVTVQIPVVVPPVVAPPTISIQSVMTNGGAFVDLTNVSGQINVALNVDVPTGNNVSKVETLIDGTTACSQTFTQGSSAAVNVEATNATVIVCSINTAALKADGTPVYANGAHTITARLVGPNGSVIANPATEVFVLNNGNALNLLVTPGKTATNPDNGKVYSGHGLTVKVTPAIFGLNGANITSMTVDVGYATLTKTITSNTTPVTFVFSDSILNAADIEGLTTITASSTLSTGFDGPESPAPQIQMLIDEVGPSFNSGIALNGGGPFWLNATSILSKAALGYAATDGGVNTVTYKLEASPNTTTKTWTAAPATAVDMGPKAGGSMLLRATACDALDNCTMLVSDPFGVDLVPPRLDITAAANKAVNPAVLVNVLAQDTGLVGTIVSGIPTGQYSIKVVEYIPGGNKCFNANTSAETAMPTDGCAAVTAGVGGVNAFTFNLATTQAYDSLVVTAVDSAGNTSAVATRLYLFDTTAPTINGILPSAPLLAGGSAVSFTTGVSDNIDLASLSGVLTFADLTAVDIGTATLDAFGLPMTTSIPSAALPVNPFMISIQHTNADGTPHVGGAADTSFNAAGVALTVKDQAGLSASQALNILPNITSQSNFTFTGAAAVDTFKITQVPIPATLVHPVVDTVKATVVLPNSKGVPFTAVNFYELKAGVLTLIATQAPGQGEVSQPLLKTSITWSLPVSIATAGVHTYVVIGVDANGHGLVSQQVTITVT